MVDPNSSSNPALIVGVIVIVIAVLAGIVGVIVGLKRCRNRKRTEQYRDFFQNQVRGDVEDGTRGWSRPQPSTEPYTSRETGPEEVMYDPQAALNAPIPPTSRSRSDHDPHLDTSTAPNAQFEPHPKPSDSFHRPDRLLTQKRPHLAIPSSPRANRKSTRRGKPTREPSKAMSRKQTLTVPRQPTQSMSTPTTPIIDYYADSLSPSSPYSLYSLPTPDDHNFDFSEEDKEDTFRPVPLSPSIPPSPNHPEPSQPTRPNPNLNRTSTKVISNIFRTRAANVGVIGELRDEDDVEHIERSGSIVNYSGKKTQKWKRVDREQRVMENLDEVEEDGEPSRTRPRDPRS
ncbi:hypothetical protein V5O48_001463 [Marasmius crinis-equi]|uniref:Uncharacterized protein n=1 Tax=Marasmius crinis-equi TaxID=585013 RepID=A0ABR3FYR8_9AGAR